MTAQPAEADQCLHDANDTALAQFQRKARADERPACGPPPRHGRLGWVLLPVYQVLGIAATVTPGMCR